MTALDRKTLETARIKARINTAKTKIYQGIDNCIKENPETKMNEIDAAMLQILTGMNDSEIFEI